MAVSGLSPESSVLVMLVVLADHVIPPSALASVMTRLAYYNQSVTWNAAHDACIQAGGILLQIRDDDKQAVVREAFQSLGARNADRLWLGQVRPSIEQPQFVHTDTCAPVTWAAWALGEPRISAENLCLWADVLEWRWETANCSQHAQVICEHRTDVGCLYQPIDGETLDDPIGEITTVSKTTASDFSSDCRRQCDESLNNGVDECWAVTFDDSPTNNCALHFGTNQSYVHATRFRQTMLGKTLYLKKCYQVIPVDDLTITPVETEWNHYDCAAGEFSLFPTEECDCPCEPLTAEESRLFMADILSSLTIDTSSLSVNRRRYYSVVENDVITLGLGYSGVIFLVIFFLVIILSDVDVLVRGRKALFTQ